MNSMDSRKEDVLSSLISVFTRDGGAVGSATLAKYLGSRFSSATIRNIMGDLEKMGLLTHRYTSGGRIPTERGIRYYVDKLLKVEYLHGEDAAGIKSQYKEGVYSMKDMLKRTSGVLSTLSRYAGLVVTPLTSDITIKQMEFISLSGGSLLGIFVGTDGQVENRVVKTKEKLTYAALENINNYCNRAFYGLTLSEAKDKAASELYRAKEEYDEMITRALVLSQSVLEGVFSSELFVEGGPQLLSIPGFVSREKASSMMDALEEKRRIIELLMSAMESDRVNVFIGSESGYEAISDCSVVSASYGRDGKVLGTLGVIGPTRMDYSKVIPIVDCTARLVSEFLEGREL